MPSGPELRVAQLLASIGVMRTWSDGTLAAWHERVGADRAAAYEAKTRLAWAPLDLDVALTEVVFERHGEPGIERLTRGSIGSTVDTPILRPLLRGFVRVVGPSVGAVLRAAPRGYGQLYRGCGRWAKMALADGTLIEHQAPPKIILDSEAYVMTLAYALRTVIYQITGEKLPIVARREPLEERIRFVSQTRVVT